jgi:hypothetical protein
MEEKFITTNELHSIWMTNGCLQIIFIHDQQTTIMKYDDYGEEAYEMLLSMMKVHWNNVMSTKTKPLHAHM